MIDDTRRAFLGALGSVPVAWVATGCIGGGGQTGTLATRVTDQPADIEDFERCVVTIVGMWLGPEGTEDEQENGTENENGSVDGGEENEATGREYYEYDEPQEADLVNLQDESTRLVDERELEVGSYAFLQLDIDSIDAVLEDGSSANVEMPGEAPLKFNKMFEIREDSRTVFTGDFTPVKRGRAGGYVLQPVARGIQVRYEGPS